MSYKPLDLQNLQNLTLAGQEKIPNPWMRKTWNVTHQMQVYAHSPELAESFKAQAQRASEARQTEIAKLLSDRNDINERLQQLGYEEPRIRR